MKKHRTIKNIDKTLLLPEIHGAYQYATQGPGMHCGALCAAKLPHGAYQDAIECVLLRGNTLREFRVGTQRLVSSAHSYFPARLRKALGKGLPSHAGNDVSNDFRT